MSQGPLCPNLTQKVQKEVSQMANHKLSCAMLYRWFKCKLKPPKKGAVDNTEFGVGRNNNATLSNVAVEQNTLLLKIVESSRSRLVDGEKLRRHLLRDRYSPARTKKSRMTEKSPSNANLRQSKLTEGRTPQQDEFPLSRSFDHDGIDLNVNPSDDEFEGESSDSGSDDGASTDSEEPHSETEDPGENSQI